MFVEYSRIGKLFVEMAKKSWDVEKDPFPIWGICQGFNFLVYLFAKNNNHLKLCNAEGQATNLNKNKDWNNSKIGKNMPKNILSMFENEALNFQNHKWCLTPTNFTKFEMEESWYRLSSGFDFKHTGKTKVYFSLPMSK